MSCPFSKYKNFFGKPNTGVHSYRFLNTAIVDYLLSIVLAIFITYLTSIPLVLTTISILLLGIILHALFGVNTNSVKFFKLNCS